MLQYELEEICVPKESVNDDTVVLVEWHVANGDKVKAGDIVATVETSKAAFDIESPGSGYVFYRLEKGAEVAVGSVLAVVSDVNELSARAAAILSRGGAASDDLRPSGNGGGPGVRFSKTALKMMAEHNIDKRVFSHKRMVTRKDVLEFLKDSKRSARTEGESGNGKGRGAEREATPIEVGPGVGERILILGGGGHAKICIDMIKQMRTLEIVGIVDSNLARGERVLGVPVLAGEDELENLYNQGIRLAVNGVGAVSDPPVREEIYRKLKRVGFGFPNIIHPRAAVEPSVVMGEGNQIMANAIVGADARLHNNCIVNAGAIVSHDCVLHDNAHVSPGAVLAANITVGRNTLIGMGCTVYLGLEIGDNVVIYNGTDVTRNVKEGEVLKR
jgi:sugar O-acyltransferase (sialic acid O-acetyltransferase NeuD family)